MALSLGAACFLFTAYHTENIIGSPSSTSSLVLIFIPIFSLPGAIIGGRLGFVLSLILRFFKIQTISLRIGLAIIAGAVLIAGLSGFMMVRIYVALNKPRVVFTKGLISKTAIPPRAIVSNNVTITFEQRNKGKTILWNDKKVTLSFPSDEIHVVDSNGDFIVQASLSRFDYIRELQATEVNFSTNNKRHLAILAYLRATSFHTMLLIYSATGQLIYQEIFDNRGQELIMSVDKSLNSTSEVLIVKTRDGTFSYSK